MKFYTSEHFDLNLPDGHRFPGRKYGMLKQALLDEGILKADQLLPSPQASTDDIRLAHDAAYVEAFETGALDAKSMRRIGFPWSENLVKRTRATIGGALAAMEAALEQGVCGQLAGGTHHAHADFGAGYCIFNDFAVVARKAVASGKAKRVAIIDLDVHQGDGNAAILGPDPSVFVFSMHGEKNFPFRKHDSDLDIPLADGLDDAGYLAVLEDALPQVFAFKPDLVLYQCGVDPLAEDRLGRLHLTHEGLKRRDRLVLETCRDRHIPVSMGIGGGYADPIEASVKGYVNTYKVAKEVFGF